MTTIHVKPAFAVHLIIACVLIPTFAAAQSNASISGTVKDSSGNTIANARISVSNSSTRATVTATSGPDGKYTLAVIPPGNYTVTMAADGFSSSSANVTLSPGASQKLDVTLTALPNAPGASPSTSPSLNDLGFSAQQTQSNPQLQATLERRTEMLKIHQRLGVITLAPMAAALITGPMAKAKGRNGQPIKEPTQGNLDFHAALGGATTALYFSTAYFAIRAPRIPGTHKKGAIRMHEALAFVHGTGMILTPIAGAMAFKQESDGEKAHGLASAHGTIAWITASAYGASIVAVSWPIHLKFWEK